ncbi:MAG: hypothetical protein ACPGPE_04705 [Planctomycetota bacterium]
MSFRRSVISLAYQVSCLAASGALLFLSMASGSASPASVVGPASIPLMCPGNRPMGSSPFTDTIVVCEAEPTNTPTKGEIKALAQEYEQSLWTPTFKCTMPGGQGCPNEQTCVKIVDFLSPNFTYAKVEQDANGNDLTKTGQTKAECESAGATFIDGGEILSKGDVGDHPAGTTYRKTTITWSFLSTFKLRCICPDN